MLNPRSKLDGMDATGVRMMGTTSLPSETYPEGQRPTENNSDIVQEAGKCQKSRNSIQIIEQPHPCNEACILSIYAI
jgi:hypothetical protein